MKEQIKGVGVALITPFDQSGNIDFDSLKKLLKHVSEHCHFLVVMGTTGESATLSKVEKEQVLAFIHENNEQQLPIVYGIGGNNTSKVCEEVKEAPSQYIDAILSVSPYYNKPSQQGIINHFNTIAEQSENPIILYNVPGRTGSNMSSKTTLSLSEHPNIIGIKDATSDMHQLLHIAANKPNDFVLLSGDDLTYLPILAIGGEGIISVVANAIPETTAAVYNSFLKKDMTRAAKAAQEIGSIFNMMFDEGNPAGVKEFCKQLNICENYLRPPLTSVSAELSESIKSYLKNKQNF